MIEQSQSLKNALERETVRFCGSQAVLSFYDGECPPDCNQVAAGRRIVQVPASEQAVRLLVRGVAPEGPPGTRYWRLYDANGNVCMQGSP